MRWKKTYWSTDTEKQYPFYMLHENIFDRIGSKIYYGCIRWKAKKMGRNDWNQIYKGTSTMKCLYLCYMKCK